MSVINKMLQDLDRRQALGAAAEAAVLRPRVGVEKPRTGGHEWFWRTLVVLLAAALLWMGWVAYQLLPRKGVATELAFQAAAEARSRAAAKPVEKPAEPKPAETPAPPPAVESVAVTPVEEP